MATERQFQDHGVGVVYDPETCPCARCVDARMLVCTEHFPHGCPSSDDFRDRWRKVGPRPLVQGQTQEMAEQAERADKLADALREFVEWYGRGDRPDRTTSAYLAADMLLRELGER